MATVTKARKRLKVTQDGTTKTYAALSHIAWHLLETAKNNEEGSLLNLQAAAVFYAFTFEAYLNHVGAKEIPFWEEIERISYNKKLNVIKKHLGMKIDHGSPPFQSIRELFDLRNTLAHGRTLTINQSFETDEEPDQYFLWRIHDWEKLTAEKVSRYAADLKTAVGTINKARRQPDDEFELWNKGVRGGRIELIK